MTERRRNILIGILFFAVGVFISVSALGIKPRMKNDMGSGFYPLVLGFAIIAISLLRLITVFRQPRKNEEKKELSDLRGGWLTILLLCAYVLMFNKIGFLLSTAIYLFAQMWILTPRDKWSLSLMSIVSIITPLFLYVMFVFALNIPLPKGMLGF